jgi:hypothetical protein
MAMTPPSRCYRATDRYSRTPCTRDDHGYFHPIGARTLNCSVDGVIAAIVKNRDALNAASRLPVRNI